MTDATTDKIETEPIALPPAEAAPVPQEAEAIRTEIGKEQYLTEEAEKNLRNLEKLQVDAARLSHQSMESLEKAFQGVKGPEAVSGKVEPMKQAGTAGAEGEAFLNFRQRLEEYTKGIEDKIKSIENHKKKLEELKARLSQTRQPETAPAEAEQKPTAEQEKAAAEKEKTETWEKMKVEFNTYKTFLQDWSKIMENPTDEMRTMFDTHRKRVLEWLLSQKEQFEEKYTLVGKGNTELEAEMIKTIEGYNTEKAAAPQKQAEELPAENVELKRAA